MDQEVQQEEVTQQEQEQQQAEESQHEADEAAGFAEAFGEEVRGQEPPTDKANEEDAGQAGDAAVDEVTGQEEQVPAAEEQQSQGAEDVQAKLAEMLAKMPKIEEMEQMTSAEIRKLHGKFGEIKSALQELQKSVGNTGTVRRGVAKLDRLREHFPELAEVLAEDLNEVTGGVEISEEQLNPIVEKRVAGIRDELQREMQVNLLKIQHPDFLDVYKSPEFDQWKKTLPPDEQQKLEESWDATYLAPKFTEFKTWRNERNKSVEKRQERLRGAITPRTSGAPVRTAAMTEEDGFKLAFKK